MGKSSSQAWVMRAHNGKQAVLTHASKSSYTASRSRVNNSHFSQYYPAMDCNYPNSEANRDGSPTTSGLWVLCRGIKGLFNQSTGLAEVISGAYDYYPTQLRLPWRRLPLRLIPVWPRVIQDHGFLRKTPPRLILSGGRHGVIPSLYLKKKFGDRVFTIHVQDPTINPNRFDMVIAPEHDFIRGENVLLTNGAIHHLTDAKLKVAAGSARAQELLSHGKQVVAVLLGGPNKYYDFTNEDVLNLVARLKQLTATQTNQGAQYHLAIIRSRRTPESLWSRIYQEFRNEHFVWDGSGENPYLPAIAIADHIIATGDSVSMISEATMSGRPIHVFQLTETRPARRFRRFHQQFEERGFTRPFDGPLSTWSYDAPNDTLRVAETIRAQIASRDKRKAA